MRARRRTVRRRLKPGGEYRRQRHPAKPCRRTRVGRGGRRNGVLFRHHR
jgi:hypothetical protein